MATWTRETYECAYCNMEIDEADCPQGPVPAADDDDAWAEEARHHDPACEWCLTRAHRRNVPGCPETEDATDAG